MKGVASYYCRSEYLFALNKLSKLMKKFITQHLPRGIDIKSALLNQIFKNGRPILH